MRDASVRVAVSTPRKLALAQGRALWTKPEIKHGQECDAASRDSDHDGDTKTKRQLRTRAFIKRWKESENGQGVSDKNDIQRRTGRPPATLDVTECGAAKHDSNYRCGDIALAQHCKRCEEEQQGDLQPCACEVNYAVSVKHDFPQITACLSHLTRRWRPRGASASP